MIRLAALATLTATAASSVPSAEVQTLADLFASGDATRLGTPCRVEPGAVTACDFTEAGLVIGRSGASELIVVDTTGKAADQRIALEVPSTVRMLPGAKDLTLLGSMSVLRSVSLETGKVTHTWEPLGLVHTALATSADGRIAVGTNIMVEQLDRFDLVAHEPLEPVPIGDHWTRQLCLSADGAMAALFDLDGRLRVLDLGTGETLLDAPDQPDVTGLGFSPDGKLLALGGESSLTLLSTETWEAVDGISGWDEATLLPLFSPDGVVTYFGTDYGSLYGIDVAQGEVRFYADLGLDRVTAMDLSDDGSLLAAGDVTGRVRVFDVASAEEVFGPKDAHSGDIWSMAWGAAGPLSLDGDGVLAHWDLAAGGARLVPLEASCGEVVVLPNAAGAAAAEAGQQDAALVGGSESPLWSSATKGAPKLLLEGEWDAACLGATDTLLLLGTWAGTLQIIDRATGEVRSEVTMPDEQTVLELALLSDGKQAACAFGDGLVAVVDLATGALAAELVLPELPELPEAEEGEQSIADALGYTESEEQGDWCAGIADAGRGRVLLAMARGRAAILGPGPGEVEAMLELGGDEVQDVAASATRLAVAHTSGVSLFNRSGKLLRTIKTEQPVQTLAMSPDGKRLALGLFDGSLALITTK